MSDTLLLTTGPVAVAARLPDPHLPDANWADAYEIETSRNFSDMRSLAQQTIGDMPRWAKGLLWLRNIVVVPFGLKSDGLHDAAHQTSCIGIFPILHETDTQIVLGLDDRHLDFRIVVDRHKTAGKSRIRATTLVQRHNAFGRCYITLITPFHRLIVRSVLSNAV